MHQVRLAQQAADAVAASYKAKEGTIKSANENMKKQSAF